MAGAAMTRMRGAAIILAMLIAALAAAVAATVFADQQRWGRTVELRRDQVQAQALAMAGVLWARQILDDDARRSEIDHLGEPWALALPPIPMEDGEIRGAIVDAQGRLNVNALGSAREPRRPSTRASRRSSRSAERRRRRSGHDRRLDRRGRRRPRLRCRRRVLPRAAPCRISRQTVPLLRVAELGVVKGMTPRALSAVLPFLSALPTGTPVNVNTAPPEVLARHREQSRRRAPRGIPRRPRATKPFTTVAEFRARLPDGATLASDLGLSVGSSYFYVTIEARQGATRSRARALVRRGGGAASAIVWQIVE